MGLDDRIVKIKFINEKIVFDCVALYEWKFQSKEGIKKFTPFYLIQFFYQGRND